jgi:hypothetical protein
MALSAFENNLRPIQSMTGGNEAESPVTAAGWDSKPSTTTLHFSAKGQNLLDFWRWL